MRTSQSNHWFKIEGTRILNHPLFEAPFWLLIGLMALGHLVFIGPQAGFAEGESSQKETTSILEVPSPDNEVTLTFNLYHVKSVQYFSAGVGVEERNASYPAYPLKLIFVQGERAFLAEVEVYIAELDGTLLVEIPSHHVMGPWLFVELPPGTFIITATDSRQHVIKKEVHVGGGGTQVVHFRWPT